MRIPFLPDIHPLVWGTEIWMLPPAEIAVDFPLLIKYIDPKRDLSIQVHPNDEVARSHGLKSGKTEMWYVMGADEGARLLCGLKQTLTPAQFRAMAADGSIVDTLATYELHQGDCFFVPAGCIHALGAGCRVCEIQQNEPVTYRIYDYGRLDALGNPRELHLDLAAECIDYTVRPDYRTYYTARPGQLTTLVQCPYFTTRLVEVNGEWEPDADNNPLAGSEWVVECVVEGDDMGQVTLLTGDDVSHIRITGHKKVLLVTR